MPPRIFHLAFEADWRAAVEAGAYRVSTRGATLDEVGFIHADVRACRAEPYLLRRPVCRTGERDTNG